MSENILSVVDLNTSFRTDRGEVMAVNGVSFNLDRGKILGIVGESGSGKSVTAYSIMQILEKNGSIKKGPGSLQRTGHYKVFRKTDERIPRKMLFYHFPGSYDQPEPCIYYWKPVKRSD